MRIFVPHCSGMLTDHLPHGDGLVAHGFLSRLAERGHDVFAAAERIDLAKPVPPNLHLYPIKPRVSGRLLQRIDYMLQVRSLFKTIDGQKDVDVIHQMNPVYTGLSLALLGTKCPIVLGPYVGQWPDDPDAVSISQPFLKAFLKRMRNAIARCQQKFASALLVTTDAATERIVFRNASRPQTYLLPHGIDSDLFSPAVTPSGDKGERHRLVILFLANVSERKGIFDLITAFELLSARFPQLELWIAGDGDGLMAAQAAASRLSSCSKIHFLGRQKRLQTVDLYRQADIYCLPSYGEPYGMTVAEAMSSGLPVVVTNAGGPACLVDQEGGLRVPVGRADALASALETLVKDHNLRRSMGLHNRAKVLGTMTWARVIDKLEQIYTAVVRCYGRTTFASDELANDVRVDAALKGQTL